MDIRKERKAFEEYLISQGVDLKYIPSIHFNGCIYDQGDDFDEDQQEALGEINLGWNAWQAAKAQAVPECKWVQDEDGVYLTDCCNMFVLECDTPHENGMLYCCYCGGKLIEAKEPAND